MQTDFFKDVVAAYHSGDHLQASKGVIVLFGIICQKLRMYRSGREKRRHIKGRGTKLDIPVGS